MARLVPIEPETPVIDAKGAFITAWNNDALPENLNAIWTKLSPEEQETFNKSYGKSEVARRLGKADGGRKRRRGKTGAKKTKKGGRKGKKGYTRRR